MLATNHGAKGGPVLGVISGMVGDSTFSCSVGVKFVLQSRAERKEGELLIIDLLLQLHLWIGG